jgi:uncharacterized protein YfiM (DUF2279 family)
MNSPRSVASRFLLSCFITTLSILLCGSAAANHIIPAITHPDSIPALTESQKKSRPWIVGGLTAGIYGGSLVILNDAWFEDYTHTSFQVFNDSKEWLQVDKIGHTWSAYHINRASATLWQWAGLSHKKSVWIGGISSFAYLTAIEYMDAHSAKWGWSWSDIAADVAGSALYIAQELSWKQQRLQLKFSFHRNSYSEPMLEQRADDLFGKSFPERVLKDYNAQTYWLSANIKSFLPESNLPAWLNIAFGYGADGMFGGFENRWEDEATNEITRHDIPRKRQYYISPDIDFTKIKSNNKFVKIVFFLLNSLKCPAPALMIDSKGKFRPYLIYF